MEERNKKLFVKPSNIEFDPRAKMKGKGGSATRHHIRRTVIEQVGLSEFLFRFHLNNCVPGSKEGSEGRSRSKSWPEGGSREETCSCLQKCSRSL